MVNTDSYVGDADSAAVGGVSVWPDGTDGANKAYTAATTARDSAETGSEWALPITRSTNTGDVTAWESTWEIDGAGMKGWYDNNEAAGKTAAAANDIYTWWLQAHVVSENISAWDTAFASTPDWSSAFTEATVGTDVPCDVANYAGAGVWLSAVSPDPAVDPEASIAECKAACVNWAGTNHYDGMFLSGTTDRVNYNPSIQPTLMQYCGAASYTATAGSGEKCKSLIGAHDASAGTGASGDDCTTYTASAGILAYYTQQQAAATAYQSSKNGSTEHTDMVAAVATQVALEKAWLGAWYDLKHWDAVQTQLDTSESGSVAKPYGDAKTTLEGNADQGRASKLGSAADVDDADTALTNANNALDAFAADEATASAAVAELGSRILRAGAEITELRTLAAADGAAEEDYGTLDREAVDRLAEFEAYRDGARAAAEAELAAAQTPVAARTVDDVSGEENEDGGALVEAEIAARATWVEKQGLAATAEENLTAVLPLEDGTAGTLAANKLSELRQAVEDATETWTE